MLKIAAFVFVLAASVPAAAQTPATSVPGSQTQAKLDPLDKLVCRTEEGLGSRLNRKKVCMTLRDWKDQADDSRQALEKLQQQGDANPFSG